MAEHTFRLWAVTQIFDHGLLLVEPLLFPEVSTLGDDREFLHLATGHNAERLCEVVLAVHLHQRHAPEAIETSSVTLTLNPATRSAVWRQPVTLTFPVVRWRHADDAVAFVPALGIEVVAPSAEELERLLPEHLTAALMRTRATHSLGKLAQLQRSQQLHVEPLSITANLKTPKQLAQHAEEKKESDESVLKEVGTDLTQETLDPAFELDDLVTRLAETLTGRSPRSVLLVGPSGVGKTAAFRELVRQRKERGLTVTPFWGTSGARLVAGMSGFGMWEQRCLKLCREAAKKRAILHLGNLVELMEVGRGGSRGQGIASFLRTHLGRGEFLAVVECTPEQLPVIERQDPHLLEVFAQVSVEEPTPERGRSILLSVATEARRREPPLTEAALDRLDRLHRRYATYSAYPGRPLRFLRNLLNDLPPSRKATVEDVTRAFSRETGLPHFLLEESAVLDLDATRQWFAQRVIGQSEAVGWVVDVLATVKAALTRPRKPIASLMFIGPTGVGKTEMAKALAEFLFGGKDRLTRLDMSEYSDPGAVQRLIGTGCSGEGVLTSRLREQPFAVVLLDEFEKAHPLLFDLLLQVLGEGRLTDAAGRLADFSNAVVILTSNLGSESYRQGQAGFVKDGYARAAARDHFVRAVEEFVRPELYNRIDRVVPFAPLDEATVLGIAQRQLQLLEQRDGVRYRGVVVDVAPEVAAHLARKGYDVRYGARPLKRAIERELLAPLADRMNEYADDAALEARVTLAGPQDHSALALHVRARTDEQGRQILSGAASAATESVGGVVSFRRDVQALRRCSVVLEVLNEVYSLRALERRVREYPSELARYADRLSRLARLQRVLESLDTLHQQACRLEDEALSAFHDNQAVHPARLRTEVSGLRQKWFELLLTVYCLNLDDADSITLAVYGELPLLMFGLASAYYEHIASVGGRADVVYFAPHPGSTPENPVLARHRVPRPDEFLSRPTDGVIGIGFGIRASAAYPRYAPEAGVHNFTDPKLPGRCYVETSTTAVWNLEPPHGVERRGGIPTQPRRRTYHWHRTRVEDHLLGKELHWSGDALPGLLAELIEQTLRQNLLLMVKR